MAVGIDVQLFEMTDHHGVYDLQLDANGDVATIDAFDTAIFVSLFADARASDSQVQRPEDRRGWIGNERTPGFEMGGLLWIWDQPRLNRDTANGIEDAAQGALSWLVTDGYALAVSATATLQGPEKLTLTIDITQPDGTVESRQFDLWALTGTVFGEAAA